MYLSPKEVKERYKITNQTLYNWRTLGKIQYRKLPSGSYVYYPLEHEVRSKLNVLYARVSNTKQKSDLERQQTTLRQFMSSNGYIVDKEFTDIASGMNESRKGFNNLLNEVFSGNVDTVYITYKDRLTRFGFTYLETIFNHFGTKIVPINSTVESDFQTELTQDLISIIHHFSMKMYSSRRKTLKALSDELKSETI